MTISDIRDMPTEKYPGVLEFFWLSSLSPSQFCMLNTTAALTSYSESSAYVAMEMFASMPSGNLALDARQGARRERRYVGDG